ncbi:hypothetical protein MIMGU_mgv1a022888mg, partial [Erythranthe guttata]
YGAIVFLGKFGVSLWYRGNLEVTLGYFGEQLHRIFKLCGSPLEEYWKKWKLPHATISKSQQSYKGCIKETFKDFPYSSLPLIVTLLAIHPIDRLIVRYTLNYYFLYNEPKYPPSKEMDAKRCDEKARRFGK